MKSSPENNRAAERMQPGMIVAAGFLGDGDRSLSEIIASDEQMIRHLGLEFDDIAALLGSFMEKAKQAQGNEVIIEGKWKVILEESRGRLPCPYGDGMFFKNRMTVTRLAGEQKLIVTDLSLHLLAKHHFLQGKGSPFRLEPLVIKSVLS